MINKKGEKKTKMKKKDKLITQRHHLIYASDKHKQEDVTGRIYKGEHWILTQFQRRKNISKCFIKSLKLMILLNEEKAVDLDEGGKK